MMRDGGPPERSPGRRIFIWATWVALVYSVYSIGSMPEWQAWLPADDSRGVAPVPHGKPDEAELAGTWVPDERTAERLRGLNVKFSNGSTPQLSLTKESFEARDVPYLTGDGGPRVLFASWRGSWNLYRQHDTWAVFLPGGPLDVRGFLYGEKPPYRLMLTAGDPLVNEPLWFVKK